MHCRSCGAELPVRAAHCPMCGAVTPSNVSGSELGKNEPTAFSADAASSKPATDYGSPPYGTPRQNPDEYVNPYEVPPPPPPPPSPTRTPLIIGVIIGVVILLVLSVVALVDRRTTETFGGTPADVTFTAQAQHYATAIAQAQTNTAIKLNATNQANPTSPPKGIYIGGVDLDGYCRFLGDRGVSLDGSTANDWHCITQSGAHVGLSVIAACQWQYKRSDLTATTNNVSDPNSWGCYTT